MEMTLTAEGLTQLVREVFTHHMLEVASEPTFVLNAESRIVIANRASTALGWEAHELVGRHWEDLVDGYEGISRMLSTDVALSAPGVAVVRDGWIRRRDGKVDAVQFVTYRLWLGQAGSPGIVIVRGRSTIADGFRQAG